jgi:phosphatidylglycerophosphatase GEP4
MRALNVSATLNVFRVLARPGLCLPHATVSTFNDLPVPLNRAFEKYGKVDIRAVVLDKDDCFARPNEKEIYKPYRVRRTMVYLKTLALFRSIPWFLELYAFP